MFGALLQHIAEAGAELGANVAGAASQTQTMAQSGSPATMMALIQNSAALKAGKGATANDNTVGVLPAPAADSAALPEGTKPDVAALLAHLPVKKFSTKDNVAVADNTISTDPKLHIPMPSTATAAAASTSTPAPSTSVPSAVVSSDKTAAASDDVASPTQPAGDAATFNAFAALFAAQWTASHPAPTKQPVASVPEQTPSLQDKEPVAANNTGVSPTRATQPSGTETTPTLEAAAQAGQALAQQNPPATPPVMMAAQNTPAQTAMAAQATNQSAQAARQNTHAVGTPAIELPATGTPTTGIPVAGTPGAVSARNMAPVTAEPSAKPHGAPQASAPTAGAAATAVAQSAPDDAEPSQALPNPPAPDQASPVASDDHPTTASTTDAANSTPAPIAPASDQSTAQAMMAAAIAAPPPVAAAPITPVPSETANPTTAKAAALAAAQANDQAAVPASGAKPDLKNKTAPSTKAHAAADKPSGNEPAASTTGDDHPAIAPASRSGTPNTPAAVASEPKQVQPGPVHAAAVSPEKPAADANAMVPPPNPLAPVGGPAVVAAKIEVTAQKNDSDAAIAFDKLGLTIAARSAEGLHHFDIRLDPAELGKVQVRLTVDDKGQAQATLVADKQQTLDLLQRDSSSLNRALQDAGLNLSNNGLNFSLREQYQQNEAGGQARRRSLSAAAILATDASQSRSSQGSYAPNSVRLDIRV